MKHKLNTFIRKNLKVFSILAIAFLVGVLTQSASADGLDSLDDLSDLAEGSSVKSGGDLDGLDDSGDLGGLADSGDLGGGSGSGELDLSLESETSGDDDEDSSGLSVSVGGYLKTLAYWNQEEYSDLLWERYQLLAAGGKDAPAKQKLSGYNNVGTRLQIKVEGYLGDSARLFTAMNVNYNIARSLHESGDDKSSNTEIRMMESFIELYGESRTWKVGSQIVTWSYMEGVEVPTDRVNARDSSYKSTEYEDSKLASTGVLLTQNIGDSQFEIMYIPVSQQNIAPEFQKYFFTGDDEQIDYKTNNGKWASRFSGTLGNLDLALSYVEGLDVDPDLTATMDGKVYNRIQSPGLDLQYNFGSFLAKLSAVYYQTEDRDGDDPLIKNSWTEYATGIEFSVGGSTINFYAGQFIIDQYKTDATAQSTNFLLGQMRERTDFVSGHITADFLTGNALSLTLMAAGYWDEDGEPVQAFVKPTVTYTMADGLDVLFSPSYVDYMNNILTDVQIEVKYSF